MTDTTTTRVQQLIAKIVANAELIENADKGEICINFSGSNLVATVKIHI